MLLASLGTSVANVGLPALVEAFDASFQAVQWVVLAYLLSVTTLIVGAGRLADVVGQRRLLLVGIALFTGASLASGFAPTLPILVTARAAQGLGAAVMMALGMAFVGEAAPRSHTGRAMGLLGTMSALGTALGPSLGGALIASMGWRAIFLVNVPIGAAALWLVRRYLPRLGPRSFEVGAFDLIGTVLLASALGAFALAMTVGRGQPGSVNLVLLGLAAVFLAAFVRWQKRARVPLVTPAVLRDRELGARLAANALVATVMMTTLVVGPFYLTRPLGLAAAQMGVVMTVGPLLSAFAGAPGGRLVDRIGPRRASLVGLAAITAGGVLLAVISPRTGAPGYLGPISFVTVGYALFQAANNTAVMSGAGMENRGVIAGALNLSRNLGLLSGAALMGAVFAGTAGVSDITAATPQAVAHGARTTFAVATALVLVAVALVLGNPLRGSSGLAARAALVLGLLTVEPLRAQPRAPAPLDPYPLAAAGWGPLVGNGRFMSRWAEDWRARRAAGRAPALKALPLGGGGYLTVSGEARMRLDAYRNARLARGDDYRQGLLRTTLGADLRLGPWLRAYAEVTSGQVEGRRREAGPNFQNDASSQQSLVDVHGRARGIWFGAMIGRQEFADGPRQLVSVSDGPNLHRTWNGVRLYAHGRRVRGGAFDLRATRPARGTFDETVDPAERLRGINGSMIVAGRGGAGSTFLDPFWIHSVHSAVRVGGRPGHDVRDTYGARLWRRGGRVTFDWTLARQTGRHAGREVDAWGAFAIQSVVLAERGWRPRLDLRIDAASGGGTGGPGTVREFHPLYASTGYVAEGQFFSLANLLMVAPGLSLVPSPRTTLSLEYGPARRMSSRDAVRAGGMRAYDATREVGGSMIGDLLRVAAARTVSEHFTLFLTQEYLRAGRVLDRGGVPSGHYGQLGATLRY